MGAERELFIDIDRQPERERPRPSDVPAARPDKADPLWPALAEGDASQPPPISSRTADNLGILPTMPLAADLVESLAVLLPKSSATRPLSLAEALAAMQAPISPSTPAPIEPPAPAPPIEPAPAAEPPVEDLSPQSGPPADWLGTDGVSRVRVADEDVAALAKAACSPEAEAPDDEYLTRTYDLTRSAVAELYESSVVPGWSEPFGQILLGAFQELPRQPGWQVVDVGCGTGYPTLDLASLLGPDGDVAGLDVWGAGIDYARAGASDLRLNNVTFLVADAAECSLPDGSFDAAICNLGLPGFASPEAALKGIARLLRPDGTLLLTTNLRGTMPEFFETYRTVLNDLGLLDLGWDVERLIYLQPTPERVEALLDIAGFSIDHALNDQFVLEFPDGSAFLRSPMIGLAFLQSWRSVIGDLSLRRVVFNEIERRLNARAAVAGRLDLTVPMLCVAARRRAQE
jgi:arsenite methyltransferase